MRRTCTTLATTALLLLASAALSAAPRPAMLDPWTGPHGGLPGWRQVVPAEFPAALAAAMDESRAELRAIAESKEAPTFENTIAAMERAGATLDRVGTYYGVHASTLNLGVLPAVQREMAPKFAAFGDEITQNARLFARIEKVYQDRARLEPEAQRLTWLTYTRFVRAGAKLNERQKQRLGEINQRLASLFTQFSQNVLADETEQFTVIDSEAGLAGLPADLRAAAANAAKSRGLEGKWVVNNTRSSMEPFLTFSADRALREKVWRTYYGRGDGGGATDNNRLITEILQLRYERARLLGYKTHAHWRLEPQMAETPERAMALLESAWKPAAAAVARDVAEMQKIIDSEGGGFALAPWDYRYYSEKLRKAQYDLDFNEVKPYMQLDKLRDAMFWSAERLYGISFTPRPDVATYHPDVTAWEVKDTQGRHVGMWYLDPYARPGKRSGAWANAYRGQQRLDGEVTPIISNNSNFVKGEDGKPTLISWSDAETLFHEFGHALHGLLSDVKYPTLAGTAVARDFVEFPSQINEHWLSTPEVLSRFALHHETGEPMPQVLLDKIKRAENFGQGFDTMEYLASAVIDMKLHLAGKGPIDPDRFEREVLAELGMPAEIVMRHRTPQFGHVFASDGYSAGYYSYLWSDALTADAWEAFEEGEGAWDAEVAARFKRTILSAGNTKDQATQFREFRGRDVDTAALMRKRGFAPPRTDLEQ